MDSILKVEHVSKAFTNHMALDDVSLEVPRGKVYGLLGPNGAGKTTLIRIINHITAPDCGQVFFEGNPLTAEDVVHIGYLPEERGLYKKMKVGEQALFFARLKGLSHSEATTALKAWFERLEISSWWDKKVEELSKGMAQKVQFIVTVLHRPKLLIFDEPFSGFDPINANVLKNEILKLRDEGATVIFSTHNMSSVEELCDNITLINKSHNILTGAVADLRQQFGDNTYELVFEGSSDAMFAALNPIVKSLSSQGLGIDGLERIRFSLNAADDMRTAVAAANNAAMIRSISPQLPSMNDIFIRTVNASNSTTSTPPAI